MFTVLTGSVRFINQMSGYQLFKDTCMTSLAPFRHLVKFCKFMSRTVSKLTSHISLPRCHLVVNATDQNLCTKLMSQSVLFSCLKPSVAYIKQVGARLTPCTFAEKRHISNSGGLLVTVIILGVLSVSS
jgi:hypothetical protein